jgi:hypothetical protein
MNFMDPKAGEDDLEAAYSPASSAAATTATAGAATKETVHKNNAVEMNKDFSPPVSSSSLFMEQALPRHQQRQQQQRQQEDPDATFLSPRRHEAGRGSVMTPSPPNGALVFDDNNPRGVQKPMVPNRPSPTTTPSSARSSSGSSSSNSIRNANPRFSVSPTTRDAGAGGGGGVGLMVPPPMMSPVPAPAASVSGGLRTTTNMETTRRRSLDRESTASHASEQERVQRRLAVLTTTPTNAVIAAPPAASSSPTPSPTVTRSNYREEGGGGGGGSLEESGVVFQPRIQEEDNTDQETTTTSNCVRQTNSGNRLSPSHVVERGGASTRRGNSEERYGRDVTERVGGGGVVGRSGDSRHDRDRGNINRYGNERLDVGGGGGSSGRYGGRGAAVDDGYDEQRSRYGERRRSVSSGRRGEDNRYTGGGEDQQDYEEDHDCRDYDRGGSVGGDDGVENWEGGGRADDRGTMEHGKRGNGIGSQGRGGQYSRDERPASRPASNRIITHRVVAGSSSGPDSGSFRRRGSSPRNINNTRNGSSGSMEILDASTANLQEPPGAYEVRGRAFGFTPAWANSRNDRSRERIQDRDRSRNPDPRSHRDNPPETRTQLEQGQLPQQQQQQHQAPTAPLSQDRTEPLRGLSPRQSDGEGRGNRSRITLPNMFRRSTSGSDLANSEQAPRPIQMSSYSEGREPLNAVVTLVRSSDGVDNTRQASSSSSHLETQRLALPNNSGSSARGSSVPLRMGRNSRDDVLGSQVSRVSGISNNDDDDHHEVDEEYKGLIPPFVMKLFAIFVIFIILIIIIVVGLKQGRGTKKGTSPTASPERSKEVRQNQIRNKLSYLSENPAVWDDPASPQNQALLWLANEDLAHIDVTDTVRLETRYALAVLYHSTFGSRWKDDNQFLTPLPECDWTSAPGLIQYGIVCDSSAHVTSLKLGE